MAYYAILILIAILAVVLVVRRQRLLRLRAHLMQEAILNHDFTFRLPTRGLLPGERAMQEALNQLGDIIHQQVNQSEVESWERLTRILTHEIMNATAPITSISQSLLNRTDVKGTPLEDGIRAIHNTSQHLNAFVDSYRKLSQLQQPAIEPIHVASLVNEVKPLYPTLNWACVIPADTTVDADPNMLRQILINLVKNAVEAGAKNICIEATVKENHLPILYISNDGLPIPFEARRSIFVPFFTTKHTGTGIGLPLSRRMMMQQGGTLNLEEAPRNGYPTTFSLEWFGI